jgi:hypothetical protein
VDEGKGRLHTLEVGTHAQLHQQGEAQRGVSPVPAGCVPWPTYLGF